jgi:hypothetical protein
MFYLRERELLRKEAWKREQLKKQNQIAKDKIDELELAIKQL